MSAICAGHPLVAAPSYIVYAAPSYIVAALPASARQKPPARALHVLQLHIIIIKWQPRPLAHNSSWTVVPSHGGCDWQGRSSFYCPIIIYLDSRHGSAYRYM